ncbi:hypothetical protein [Pengzhenrongella sicca]|uniref:Uncharacterized protein n=1 Tax=Pengzhenrongella sicca TaxID=2819238 RepID=A0A8A4ZHA0_9MICO|nr:hypothetical protein [Pengzhenrongella sicca]QTE29887.1 hypothetical protein J4E96_02315 [Pengzhenrongella sicca]
MPTRLLLDGADLAGLLHRVRTEMGPGAVVVKAERVRTGGVAGFFAKEHFELTVEVPDRRPRIPRRSPLPAPVAGGPVGISALLAAADAAEARDAGGPPAPTAPAGPPPGGAPTELGWIAATPVEPAADPDAVPRLSTDAQTFASVLASIDDMAAAPALAPAASGAAPAAPASRPLPAARFAPRGAVVTPVRLEPIHQAAGRNGGGDRRGLLALGVPAHLLGPGSMDETLPLSDLLARLDRPPGLLRTPGAVVAVVGDRAQVLAVAGQLAERARQDPHDVVLAGDMQGVAGYRRRLLSPAAASRHRARVADGDQVSIVAIGVGGPSEDWPAAAALLAELGPDQAWAVVDARRKPADLRAWLAAVGGTRAFDVIAAAAVHETREPGTVLDLGAPVGWIDGLPATAVVWAAVLSERLDVGARWD